MLPSRKLTPKTGSTNQVFLFKQNRPGKEDSFSGEKGYYMRHDLRFAERKGEEKKKTKVKEKGLFFLIFLSLAFSILSIGEIDAA